MTLPTTQWETDRFTGYQGTEVSVGVDFSGVVVDHVALPPAEARRLIARLAELADDRDQWLAEHPGDQGHDDD